MQCAGSLLFAVASLLLTAGTACGAEGAVVDPSGRPVQGARVECAGESATTGPDVIAPVVRIYYPAQGAKLNGRTEITAAATGAETPPPP